MGLDLVVQGCAMLGHEAEWRNYVARSFLDEELTNAELERFESISTPGYERLEAPRVGQDEAANQWIIETRKAATPDEVASVLEEFRGYHVLRLVACDGVPEYSHGGLYDGVDETSFRGAFLTACQDVLSKALVEKAWEHKFPETAVTYGGELLAAASAARAKGPPPARPRPKPGFLARLFGARRPAPPIEFDEQLKIVEAAGRWHIFWGERGHPIRAWF